MLVSLFRVLPFSLLRRCGSWLSATNARRWLPLLLVVGFFACSLVSSEYASSFHDVLGGRLPRSDSSGWVVGTVGALRGIKQEWVVRRPLNVVFNGPLFEFALQFGRDSLLTALQLKRCLGFAAIVTVCLSLRGVLHVGANAGLAILLGSVLFSRTLENLSGLFGRAVGYTHGTELNGFIVVTFAVASLIGATRLVNAPATHLWQTRLGPMFWFRLALFIPGLLLLGFATLLRPGSLLLIPLVVVAILIRLPGLPVLRRRPAWRSAVVATLLSIVLVLVSVIPSLLMQQLAFQAMTTNCGVIGGNQGYTVYGMSRGSNWSLGITDASRLKLGTCEREINRTLLKIGKAQILRNPLPVLGLLGANLAHRLSSLVSYTLQWPLWILFAVTLARRPTRSPFFHLLSANRLLSSLVCLGGAGWLSMELFQLVFYEEAGLRPVLAYAVFPLLTAMLLLQLCVQAWLYRRNGVLQASLLDPSMAPVLQQSVVADGLPCRWQRMLLLGPPALLMLLLMWGCGLVIWPNPGFASSGYGLVSQVVDVPPTNPGSFVAWSDVSSQLSENYRLHLIVTGCSAEAPFKVRYTRARLPGADPLGEVWLACGALQ